MVLPFDCRVRNICSRSESYRRISSRWLLRLTGWLRSDPLDSQLGTTASCHQRITRRRVPVNDVTVLDGHIGAAGIHQRKAGTVERSVLDVADTLVINDDTVGVRSFRSGEVPPSTVSVAPCSFMKI